MKREQILFKVDEMQGYDNLTDICADFCHVLDRVQDDSEFRVDGFRSALKFSPGTRSECSHPGWVQNDRWLF